MRFSEINKNIIIRKENARMKLNTVQGKLQKKKKRNKAKQNSPSYKSLKI